MQYYVPFNNPIWTEYRFLVDNQSAGYTWQSPTYTGAITQGTSTANVSVRWAFTVVQQNVTVSVNGTNYANTIQVKQELQQMVGTNWVGAYYLQNYYARDKGLIKQDAFTYNSATSSFELFYEQEVRRLAIY